VLEDKRVQDRTPKRVSMSGLNKVHLLPGQPSDLPLIAQRERAYVADHEPQNLQAWQAAMH
jgi:hypothetical protein